MTLASSQDGLSLVSNEVQSGGCFQHRELVHKPWSIHNGVAPEEHDIAHSILQKDC